MAAGEDQFVAVAEDPILFFVDQFAGGVELNELAGFSFGGLANENDGAGPGGGVGEIAGEDCGDCVAGDEGARAGMGDAAADHVLAAGNGRRRRDIILGDASGVRLARNHRQTSNGNEE